MFFNIETVLNEDFKDEDFKDEDLLFENSVTLPKDCPRYESERHI